MYFDSLFNSLSDPNRRKILDLLKKSEYSVSELCAHLNITMATLSHHLSVLKNSGLVNTRREGKQIIYNLNLSVVEDAAEKIFKLLKGKNK